MRDAGPFLLLLVGAGAVYYFWSQSSPAIQIGTQTNPVTTAGGTPVTTPTGVGPAAPTYFPSTDSSDEV